MSDKKIVDLDLLDIESGAEAGATMQLLHPVTGDELGIAVHVLGADAPAYRAALRKIRDDVAANPDREPKEPEAIAKLGNARAAAAALTGWHGELRLGGEVLDFSFDNAVRAMVARSWIADQVAFFRDRRANFFRG